MSIRRIIKGGTHHQESTRERVIIFSRKGSNLAPKVDEYLSRGAHEPIKTLNRKESTTEGAPRDLVSLLREEGFELFHVDLALQTVPTVYKGIELVNAARV